MVVREKAQKCALVREKSLKVRGFSDCLVLQVRIGTH
jgi:hypothetical protein